MFEQIYKLVLLGESSVGKSSILLRFARGEFDKYSESTIGAAYSAYKIQVKDDTFIKFDIWDTAGQEKYRSLSPMYCRGASIGIVVYDITNSDSLYMAKYWVQQLKQSDSPDMIIAIVGNKSDMEQDREITTIEVAEYAKNEGLIFYEASALTGTNIKELFLELAITVQ